ncbi:GNAT family N-acetyltransferase [Nisaea sp.]|uniref:GNAT family N-acetyltransferase n=1 Tax=Nisaea sp. TaxID=2024842 RepID=UPI003265395F
MTAVQQRLETERLVLRSLARTDAIFVADLISDEDVRRYLGGPVSPEQHEATFARYSSGENGGMVWVVETKNLQTSVGLVFLSPHRDNGEAELSYQFRAQDWKRGYATEAAARVLSHALGDLECVRVIAETQTANLPSRRLLTRLGMTEISRHVRFGSEQSLYATGNPA